MKILALGLDKISLNDYKQIQNNYFFSIQET